MSQLLPLFLCARLKPHGGFGHLALAQFGQEHTVHCEFTAIGTDNVLLECWTYADIIYSDFSDFTIEFVQAFFAFKVDLHVRFPYFVTRERQLEGRE